MVPGQWESLPVPQLVLGHATAQTCSSWPWQPRVKGKEQRLHQENFPRAIGWASQKSVLQEHMQSTFITLKHRPKLLTPQHKILESLRIYLPPAKPPQSIQTDWNSTFMEPSNVKPAIADGHYAFDFNAISSDNTNQLWSRTRKSTNFIIITWDIT